MNIRKPIIITVLGAMCFIPMGVVGYINRPSKPLEFNLVPREVLIEELPITTQIITIPEITIKAQNAVHAVARPAPTPSVSASIYCKERELLTGGRVMHCDTIPPIVSE